MNLNARTGMRCFAGALLFRAAAGFFAIILGAVLACATASSAEQTFAERLGWKSNDVVVILHVDDVGMSHPSNRGAIETLEHGVATSLAVMMPCPWVPEIAK